MARYLLKKEIPLQYFKNKVSADLKNWITYSFLEV